MKKIKLVSELLFISAAALAVFSIGKIIVDSGRIPYGINPIEINRDILWLTVFAGVLSLIFLGLETIVEWVGSKKSSQK